MLVTKIDYSKSYKVEPNVRKNGNGLDEYKLSKMPGAGSHRGVSYDPYLRKFRIPFDENSREVLSITDPNERKEAQEQIIKLRTELENALGKPGVLSATSEYWDDFAIPIDVSIDRKVRIGNSNDNVLNPATNPLHKLYLSILLGNELLPLGKDEALTPEQRSSGFYLTTDDEVIAEDKETMRKNIKAQSELNKLFEDTVQYQRAWSIAYAMGLKPKANISEETLQKDLYEAITKGGMIDSFLKQCKLSNEELQISTDFRIGIALDIVKYDRAAGVYRTGAYNFRETVDESIKFLLLPESATMLAQLTEAVRKKKSGRKNLV